MPGIRCLTAWFMMAMMLVGMSACGGSRAVPKVENPYIVKARQLSKNGMEAMRFERWNAAELAFARALKAAELADEPAMVVQAWYNLGVVRVRQNKAQATATLEQARKLAEQNHLQEMAIRAKLALALFRLRHGEQVEAFEVPSDLAADVDLQAARMAQLQHDAVRARELYQRALKKLGNDRQGLRLAAEAHMGLALVARGMGQVQLAHQESETVLGLCRQVGAPRLAAHALLLDAGLPVDEQARRNKLERAYRIYTALHDEQGQRKALAALQQHFLAVGDALALRDIRQKLQALSDSSNAKKVTGKEP